MQQTDLYQLNHDNGDITLYSPTKLSKASGYLWNKNLLVQATCRGFVNAQFMQPEPAKYSKGPCLEATSFMQPEPHYYAHHPGRFFYIKDEQDKQSAQLFSVPYEPVRVKLEHFEFQVTQTEINWVVEHQSLRIELTLSIPTEDPIEIWDYKIINLSQSERKISIYPCFTIGYMSWMNQSANYSIKNNAIVASSVTPYQKLTDYPKQKKFKDKTFLASENKITSYCANQAKFEGEGGLSRPDELNSEILSSANAQYEVPIATFQFRKKLASQEALSNRLLFGPVFEESEIDVYRNRYFSNPRRRTDNKQSLRQEYRRYLSPAKGCLTIQTADSELDHFVNYWLPRQVFYHGDINRLTNDPQTRNYLQDHMGMSYLDSMVAKEAFINALRQQKSNGEMPDGILLHPDAELKYINQIPHADHSVWLPICLSSYLRETNDFEFLATEIEFSDDKKALPIYQHIDQAMDYLLNARDHRGLSLIQQGDWCDPMNMVGAKGKGVSSWLTMATSYAILTWSEICEALGRIEKANELRSQSHQLNQLVNRFFWQEKWYARGITDNGELFGVEQEQQGSIYLNPQSWSMLCQSISTEHTSMLIDQIQQRLKTPFGPMMLAPSYTEMDERIGRLTQKSPGVAENGSVYNHAAVFYAFALYKQNHAEQAFHVLKQMLPNTKDAEKRGQLPNFIPNYYRGAYHQYPEHAGRSSQLFNTGTVSWYYRCVIEELFGLYGDSQGLVVAPKFPRDWRSVQATRRFRGAEFKFDFQGATSIQELQVIVDGKLMDSNQIKGIEAGRCYQVTVNFPVS